MGATVRTAGRWVLSALSSGATGLTVVMLMFALPYITLALPVEKISLERLGPPSERTLVLYADDGKPFARRGGCVAEPISISEVPPYFVDALLSMEDRRFFYHLGLDPKALLRAALRNRQAGRVVEGGSTLTQQLVKYSYLSSDRTMERKQKEAMIALWLELNLSKHEILERYLSSAYFGEGCFGLRAATRRYFGKTVEELSLGESAYLVALLKSPSSLSRNKDAALERARLVLEAMIENGKLKPKQADAAEPAAPRAPKNETFAGYYADWVASNVTVPADGSYAPLPIHTSLNRDLQTLARDTLVKVLETQGGRRNAAQAAMVVMRSDGEVLAMVGGRDYGENRFNRAVQAQRQPGSSFKLFVYLAALRAGLHTDQTLVDRPIVIGDYEPENFGHRFRGPVSVRQAFASSINTVAVQLSEAVGRQPVIGAARDLGITAPLEPTPSLALGVWEVNLLQMTAAYSAIAAGAYPIKPWAITGFDASPEGDPIPPQGAGAWSLDEADELRSLMRGVVQGGSGSRARISIPAFGKTGTSQNHKDAWFIGFAGNLVVGVWVGNDDSSPMRGVTGGSLPAQIWHDFMTQAIERYDGFEKKPQEIAAFEAAPRPSQGRVKLALDAVESSFGIAPEAEEQEPVRRRLFGRRNGGRGLFRNLFN